MIFIWNLIAIVPLSITLTLATEQLSQELGETAGALLNITVGNLAELIILWVLSIAFMISDNGLVNANLMLVCKKDLYRSDKLPSS